MTRKNQPSLIKIVLLASSGFFMFVCMDSMGKYLGGVMPVTQAVWGRFFFHFLAILFFFFNFQTKTKY
jgi:hypothetical protein